MQNKIEMVGFVDDETSLEFIRMKKSFEERYPRIIVRSAYLETITQKD